MNKKDFVDSISSHFASKAEAARAVDAVLSGITEAVSAGEKLSLPGFGTFEKRHRAARTMTNPQTGEKMQTKATDVPAFRPGSEFKTAVASKKK